MNRNKEVLLIDICIGFIFILIVLPLVYSFYGSLEVYPNDEQNSKVRIVMGAIVLILVIIELFFLSIRYKIVSKRNREK
ncbi:hypothetical protein Bccel_0731 [Pseudobacteroides cellulosolvens ATCC 35603 = DSM 2933]|uniref:Uncharacterized protein n=1 Tax=Pseudobacteroides cellulosolvens ATCC 35603 = DSM 2933 TaxID=398512 RepID=A0A0L6JHZ4_9FIRM|nr:hypothetical protein Bccel_0731 [Pseudobacteroides cellulosolvens ATCC 35603 = DSM 2933]